jgi:tRNA A-37 threonylcarbamoyl transferase component Bud32
VSGPGTSWIVENRRWGVVPSGFKKIIDGRERLLLVRHDVAEFLTAEDCMQRAPQEKDRAGGALQGRGMIGSLKLPTGETALIRPYRHGGLFRHLLGGVFFTWPPRPFRELAIMEEVRRRGVPTVEVLAACVRPIWGPFYRGWLVTSQLQGSQDLWTALQGGAAREAGARNLFNAVASSLRELHREGIYHRDLNLKNILVRCESDGIKGYIIDFDRALLFLGEVPQALARRNLERLLRSAHKLDPKGEYISAHDWNRLVASYHDLTSSR